MRRRPQRFMDGGDGRTVPYGGGRRYTVALELELEHVSGPTEPDEVVCAETYAAVAGMVRRLLAPTRWVPRPVAGRAAYKLRAVRRV